MQPARMHSIQIKYLICVCICMWAFISLYFTTSYFPGDPSRWLLFPSFLLLGFFRSVVQVYLYKLMYACVCLFIFFIRLLSHFFLSSSIFFFNSIIFHQNHIHFDAFRYISLDLVFIIFWCCCCCYCLLSIQISRK